MSSTKNAPSFESALEQLETIVNRMESETLPLEQAIEQAEKGMLLSKQCQKALDDAKQRMEVIFNDVQDHSEA